MKRGRVMISAAVLGAVILFLCLVPVPISRIRGLALVQGNPETSMQKVLVRTAILKQLKVQPGDTVHKDETLAVFRDPDLEDKLAAAQNEFDKTIQQLRQLERQKETTTDTGQKSKIDNDIAEVTGKRMTAEETVKTLRDVQEKELILLAPCDGVIGQGPKPDDIGRQFEGARDQSQAPPTFTIHAPCQVRVWLPLVTSEYNQLRENLAALEKENQKLKKENEKGEEKTLAVTVRIHGLDTSTWQGKIVRLDESEMKYVPPMLSNRGGGPVPVKPPTGKGGLVPQTQHYLAYIDIIDPDKAVTVGEMAQVKIYLQPETCLRWAWRTVNNVFNLRLM